MRTLAFLALIFCAVQLSWCSPSLAARSVVHEKRAFEPPGWTRSHRLGPDAILPMRFGLKQNNVHRIEEYLMDVSHPESPNYGKHWTPDQVASAFSPSQNTIDAVRDWLHSAGFAAERIRLTASKGWLELNATTTEVERLLNAEYHVYSHKHGNEHIACDTYSVPAHIQHHIDLILPTVNFDAKIHPRSDPKSPVSGAARQVGAPVTNKHVKTEGETVNIKDPLKDCDEMITPNCLRALYNFRYKPVATRHNSYGIVEFTPQAFLQDDLNMFFSNFSPSLVGTAPRLVSIDGGVDQQTNKSFDFNGESNLDLEFGMALIAPQPVTLYQTGDLVMGASFNNLLDALDASYCTFEGGDDPEQDGIYPDDQPGGFNGPESCGIVKPANVISTSYGSQEPEMTAAYQIRQCNEYGKLGMMGVTILYSSGDNGVAGFDNFCIDENGHEVANGTRFDPAFPVNCPFVTAVGATQINPNSTVNDPEGACEQVIFSGGGFSDIFPMPEYQKAAVDNFFEHFPPPYSAAQFNNSGKARGYPDLSANGANYLVAIDGEFELVFGTSCSSPVVGSLITAINDARIHVGKSPVGFINPTIYSKRFAEGFNDITMGGNQGCGTPGFTAVPGWDPVLGHPTLADFSGCGWICLECWGCCHI